jgi:hypothetical protein
VTNSLVLFCKSYRNDLLRAKRLAQSIAKHNADRLPFYLCVPAQDVDVFRDTLAELPIVLLCDDEILSANPRLDRARVMALRPYLGQQIIKSEFWRLELCETLVCIDSDSYFIRDFTAGDFLAPDGTPFSVMHESKDYLQYLINVDKRNPLKDARIERERISAFFPAVTPLYYFTPTPAIWSRRVWRALDEQLLTPRGMTIVDAIEACPAELAWYGHALLAFKPIPILPREPLFRVYHYPELYWHLKRQGETEDKLRQLFLGVVRQSFWDTELETRRGERLRRWIKNLRKRLSSRRYAWLQD